MILDINNISINVLEVSIIYNKILFLNIILILKVTIKDLILY